MKMFKMNQKMEFEIIEKSRYPGKISKLYSRLAWFYDFFTDHEPAHHKKAIQMAGIKKDVETRSNLPSSEGSKEQIASVSKIGGRATEWSEEAVGFSRQCRRFFHKKRLKNFMKNCWTPKAEYDVEIIPRD